MVRNEALLLGRRNRSRPMVGDLTDLVTFRRVDELEREETHREVWAALRTLAGEQAEVVVLKIWEEMTFAEIGQILDTSPNTAASRYQYALGKIDSGGWHNRSARCIVIELARLARSTHSDVEAMIRAAGEYVRASDDLRPRVLEAARLQYRERRARRWIRHAAVLVLLWRLPRPPAGRDSDGGKVPSDRHRGGRRLRRILCTHRRSPRTRSGDGDWRMIEAFTRVAPPTGASAPLRAVAAVDSRILGSCRFRQTNPAALRASTWQSLNSGSFGTLFQDRCFTGADFVPRGDRGRLFRGGIHMEQRRSTITWL